MNRKDNRHYVDEDDIIIYDPTDDEFDDEVIEEDTSDIDSDKYKNFEQHEIWDEVDGEWFTAWLPKGCVKHTDEDVTREANAWPVTVGVVVGILAIITMAIGLSCWLYM